jgi:hypothetical protein
VRKTAKPPAQDDAGVVPAIRRIPDDAVLTLHELRAILALPKSCLGREVRNGRLRVSRRSGRYWVLGAWVHEWLTTGEVQRKQPGAVTNGVHSSN